MKDYPNIDRILKAKEDQQRALAERRKFIESGRDAERKAPNTNSGSE
jgi:hypothetical protein